MSDAAAKPVDAAVESKLRSFPRKCAERVKKALTPPSIATVKATLKGPYDKDAPIVARWRRVYLFAAAYTLFSVPISAAFYDHVHTTTWLTLDYIADVIFIVDILIRLRRTYRDEYGQLHESQEEITKKYLRSWLLFDIATAIPIDLPLRLVGNYRMWGLLRLARLGRTRSFAVWFWDLDIPHISVPVGRLVKNIIIIVYLAHWNACFFYLVSESEGTEENWVYRHHEDADGFTGTMHGIEVPLIERHMWAQYSYSYFWAMRINFFIFRDSYRTDRERAYLMVEWLIAFVLFGSIFGNLGWIIKLMDTKVAGTEQRIMSQQHKLSSLRTFMQGYNFPVDMQRQVLDHEKFVWMVRSGMDEATLFSDLPTMLQQEIGNFLYGPLIEKVPLFAGTTAQFRILLAQSLRPITILAGWDVFNAGEDGYEMYFIRMGEVELLSDDGTVLAKLQDGSHFGEIALFEQTRHVLSCRAKTDCDLCVLTRTAFEALMSRSEGDQPIVRKNIEERREQEKSRKLNRDRRGSLAANERETQGGRRGSLPMQLMNMLTRAAGGESESRRSSLLPRQSISGGIHTSDTGNSTPRPSALAESGQETGSPSSPRVSEAVGVSIQTTEVEEPTETARIVRRPTRISLSLRPSIAASTRDLFNAAPPDANTPMSPHTPDCEDPPMFPIGPSKPTLGRLSDTGFGLARGGLMGSAMNLAGLKGSRMNLASIAVPQQGGGLGAFGASLVNLNAGTGNGHGLGADGGGGGGGEGASGKREGAASGAGGVLASGVAKAAGMGSASTLNSSPSAVPKVLRYQEGEIIQKHDSFTRTKSKLPSLSREGGDTGSRANSLADPMSSPSSARRPEQEQQRQQQPQAHVPAGLPVTVTTDGDGQPVLTVSVDIAPEDESTA
eukprot:Opistho-2@81150